MQTNELWSYGRMQWRGRDLVGYEVEALDDQIGSVDEATYDVGGSYLVVDTGPWTLGKKVVLPAGVIDRINPTQKKVFVHRTKDDVKSAPEYDEARFASDAYRAELGRYYGPGGPGYRDRTYATPGRGAQ